MLHHHINHRHRHGILQILDRFNELSIYEIFVASTIGIAMGWLIAKVIFLCLLFSYEFITATEAPLFTQEQLDQFMQLQKEMEAKELANVSVQGKCQITSGEPHDPLKDCITNQEPKKERGLMSSGTSSCFQYAERAPLETSRCIFERRFFRKDEYDIHSTVLEAYAADHNSITLLAYSRYHKKNVAIHILDDARASRYSSEPLISYSKDKKKATVYDLTVLVEERVDMNQELDKAMLELKEECFEYIAHFVRFEKERKSNDIFFDFTPYQHTCNIGSRYFYDLKAIMDRNEHSNTLTILAYSHEFRRDVALHFCDPGSAFTSVTKMKPVTTNGKRQWPRQAFVYSFVDVHHEILKRKKDCFEYIAYFYRLRAKEANFEEDQTCYFGSGDQYTLTDIMAMKENDVTVVAISSEKDNVIIQFKNVRSEYLQDPLAEEENPNPHCSNKAFIYYFQDAYEIILRRELSPVGIKIEDSFSEPSFRDTIGSGSYGGVYKYGDDKVMKLLHKLPLSIEDIAILKNEIVLLTEANKRVSDHTTELKALFIGVRSGNLRIGLLFADTGTWSSMDKALFAQGSNLFNAIREQPAKMISNYMEQSIHTLKEFAPSPSRPSIIHGDIKPANILINDLFNIRFIDLGSANIDNHFVNPFGCTFGTAPGMQKVWRILEKFDHIPHSKQKQQRIVDEWLIPYKSTFDLQSTWMNLIVMAQILFGDAKCERMDHALTEEFRVAFGSNVFFDEYFYGYDFLLSRKERILKQYEDNDPLHDFFDWLFDNQYRLLPLERKPEGNDERRFVEQEMIKILSDSAKFDRFIAMHVAWAKKHTLEEMKKRWKKVEFLKPDGKCP